MDLEHIDHGAEDRAHPARIHRHRPRRSDRHTQTTEPRGDCWSNPIGAFSGQSVELAPKGRVRSCSVWKTARRPSRTIALGRSFRSWQYSFLDHRVRSPEVGSRAPAGLETVWVTKSNPISRFG